MKAIRRNSPRHTARSRDAALRRLSRTNRWLIAGTALLTGLFAELAASAFSGHPASARGSTGTRPQGHHTATKAVKPPAQPPQAAEAAPTPSEPEREAPAEAPAPAEPPAPAQEAAPEPAPEPAPETHESAPAPAPEEPPVVSGGS